eukprot:COSAG01_NODE_3361_length_6199_cov_4.450492_9_plen_244_part_00
MRLQERATGGGVAGCGGFGGPLAALASRSPTRRSARSARPPPPAATAGGLADCRRHCRRHCRRPLRPPPATGPGRAAAATTTTGWRAAPAPPPGKQGAAAGPCPTRVRCVSIFFDKNRFYIGKTQSKRPPERTQRTPHPDSLAPPWPLRAAEEEPELLHRDHAVAVGVDRVEHVDMLLVAQRLLDAVHAHRPRAQSAVPLSSTVKKALGGAASGLPHLAYEMPSRRTALTHSWYDSTPSRSRS